MPGAPWGGFGKPDGSTPQRRGDWRRPERRAGNFPYDRQITYGRGRLTGPEGDPRIDLGPIRPPVPKNTEYTPWDDDTGKLGEACRADGPISWQKVAKRGDFSDLDVHPEDFEWQAQAGGWIAGTRWDSKYMEIETAMVSPGGTVYIFKDETNAELDEPGWYSSDGQLITNDPSFKTIDTFEDDPIDESLRLLEAAGTPYLLSKDAAGSMMGTIPGTARGWAGAPFDDLDVDRKDESSWDDLAMLLGEPDDCCDIDTDLPDAFGSEDEDGGTTIYVSLDDALSGDSEEWI